MRAVAEGLGELPRVRDDGLQIRQLRIPARLGNGAGGRGDEGRRVAAAARGVLRRNRVAGDLAAGVDDLADRVAVAGAEVEDAVRARLVRAQGQQVSVGEVLDVDVVAHRGAV